MNLKQHLLHGGPYRFEVRIHSLENFEQATRWLKNRDLVDGQDWESLVHFADIRFKGVTDKSVWYIFTNDKDTATYIKLKYS